MSRVRAPSLAPLGTFQTFPFRYVSVCSSPALSASGLFPSRSGSVAEAATKPRRGSSTLRLRPGWADARSTAMPKRPPVRRRSGRAATPALRPGFAASACRASERAKNPGWRHDRRQAHVVELGRQFVHLLHVPSHPDRDGLRMRGKETVVIAAPLAEPIAFGREADQRHEQDFGYDDGRVYAGLAYAPDAAFQVALFIRVAVQPEFHRLIERGHAGQGNLVAALEEEPDVTGSRSLAGIGSVESDRGVAGDKFQHRSWRTVEHQGTDFGGQGSRMFAAFAAQFCAKQLLALGDVRIGHLIPLPPMGRGSKWRNHHGSLPGNPLTPKRQVGAVCTGPGAGQGQLPWIAYSLRDIHKARAGQSRQVPI